MEWIHSKARIIESDEIFEKNILDNLIQELTNKLAIQASEAKTQKIVVGVYLDRGLFSYISPVSIFQLGFTYVPIGTEYPKERLQYILEDSCCSLIVTNEKYEHLFSTPTICVEKINTIVKSQACILKRKKKNDAAYIIYTSGTTGVPKGIEISYDALEVFTKDVAFLKLFHENMKLLSVTSVTFDLFFLDSIVALHYGATVIIGPEGVLQYKKMLKLVHQYKANTFIMTPSRMQLLFDLDHSNNFLDYTRTVCMGGESIPLNLLRRLQKKKMRILNLYGPSETTIFSTVADLSQSDEVHVGKPLAHTEIHISKEEDQGSYGEVVICGAGVGLGYIHCADERFYCKNGKRYFKTGDVGYIDLAGNLHLKGRRDHQIKHNGYRIELEEIERVAASFANVNAAVAFRSSKGKLVLCYFTDKYVDVSFLRMHLREYLPKYMIPFNIVQMEKLLIDTNGKINRNEVIRMYENKDGNRVKEKVLEIIGDIVNEKISDCIFSLKDIESIDFIKVIIEIEEYYKFEFDDEMLSYKKLDTVESLINYVLLKTT